MTFRTQTNGAHHEILYEENGAALARLIYEDRGGGRMAITSTFVDPSLRGRGMAGQLMEELVRQLRRDGRRAVPVCSYAVDWFDRHPDARDVQGA